MGSFDHTRSPAPDAAALDQQLRQLQAATATEREHRLAAERTAAARHTVELALLAVERDTDTLTSERVEAARDQATGLAVRLTDAFANVDHLRLNSRRLLASQLPVDVDEARERLMRLFAADEAARVALAVELEHRGNPWFSVPTPLRSWLELGGSNGEG
jgi:hypothetical protein